MYPWKPFTCSTCHCTFLDPLFSNSGLSYIPDSANSDKLTWAETVKVTRKLYFSWKSNSESLCAHNVSWKVNVQTLSELSHLAEVCPVWCGHQWSEAHLDTLLSPSKDNPDTLSLVRACFLLLLWLRVLQVEDKDRENNSTKWWDKNNLIYTNKHTCHPHTASTWPCCHILLLPQPICCKKNVVSCAASHPVLFIFVSFSLFLFLPSSSSSLLLYLSPVTDSGGRTEWHAFEAGGIHCRRLNRWETDCISKYSINSLCLSCQSLSLSVLPSLLLSIMLGLPCWFPSKAYAPAVSGLPFVPVALFVVIQLLNKSPLWLQFQTVISRIWQVSPNSNLL